MCGISAMLCIDKDDNYILNWVVIITSTVSRILWFFLPNNRINHSKIFIYPGFILLTLLLFSVGNLGKLPLTIIAAASGGGAFVLIVVAVICFACVVQSRLVGTG